MTPVLDTRRWTRTGSVDGRGGGPAGISAASTAWPPRTTVPARVTTRSTSTASPGATGGSGDGPAGTTPAARSAARSVTVRCERTVLTRVPPMNRWIRVVSAQNRTTYLGAGRAEPE